MNSRLIRILTIGILLTAFALSIEGRERTTRRKLHRAEIPATTDADEATDTIVFTGSKVSIAGYEKPLRSTRESVFVTNNTSQTILSLTLTLEYFDMQGRQLHKRKVTVNASIEPNQTRIVYFPSWDKQSAFYYHRGQKPRVALATPYDVRCTPIVIITER